VDVARRQAWVGDERIPLTPTEFDLLQLLMTHPGRVITRTTILDTVWGIDAAPASNVVDRHVRTLRYKLEPRGDVARSPRFIETVARVGYRLRDVEVDVSAPRTVAG
jgi:two-component system alkaline phosphatase synthesis response regulator PhoP